MFSKGSFLVGLTVLVVAVLNIDEGLALKCYECNTWANKTCDKEFKNAANEKNCSSIEPWVQLKNPLSNPGVATGRTDSECVLIQGSRTVGRNTTTGLLRTCMPVGLTEKFLKANFQLFGVKVTSTKICSSDLCNSSSGIYAGISSVLLCIISIFVMK